MPVTVYTQRKQIMIGDAAVRPALCLDLDGTIRYSKRGEFINKPEDIVLFSGIEDRIWRYRSDGYLIFGISNQGGVAFGFKSPLDVERELDVMIALFERNPFHIVKVSYHHEGGTVEPYNVRSLLRKPGTGMLALCEVEAFEQGFVVDWDKSLFVGDRDEDEECARRAGITFLEAATFREKGEKG